MRPCSSFWIAWAKVCNADFWATPQVSSPSKSSTHAECPLFFSSLSDAWIAGLSDLRYRMATFYHRILIDLFHDFVPLLLVNLSFVHGTCLWVTWLRVESLDVGDCHLSSRYSDCSNSKLCYLSYLAEQTHLHSSRHSGRFYYPFLFD